jgi:hypothetical protein
VAGVVGQRVEQGQQQPHRQQQDQDLGRLNQVILADIPHRHPVSLKLVQAREEIEGDPEDQETAQAKAERNEQFSQKITVQQTHPASG